MSARGSRRGLCQRIFGAGGGMVLVPLIIWLVGLPDKLAFSSAISIILPLCVVSLVIYGGHDSCRSPTRSPICSAARAAAWLAGLWL